MIHRTNAFPLMVSLCFAGFAVGAPLPKDAKTPISPQNADRLVSIGEVQKRASKIIRGPKVGELYLFDWNRSVEVVDDVNLQNVRTLLKGQKPTDFRVSPDGKLHLWTERDQSTYTVEETESGKKFTIEPGNDPGYTAFSPDGKWIAMGSVYWNPKAEGVGESVTKLYDTSGKLVRTFGKSGPGALSPVFSPDGKILAVGNRNYETDLFEVSTGKLLHRLDKRMTQEVAFSPDGKLIACGYVDGTVGVWDVATGKLLQSAASGCQEIYSVDWNGQGDLFATSGREGKVILWNPRTLSKVAQLDAAFWVISVRFTADGCRLLAASASDYGAKNDRKITIWAVGDRAK